MRTARASFTYRDAVVGEVHIREGERVDDGHVVVGARPDMFDSAGNTRAAAPTARARAEVEQFANAARNGDTEGGFSGRATSPPTEPRRRDLDQQLGEALRALDTHVAEDRLPAHAAASVDDLLRGRDPFGWDAEYIAAAGDPAYERAFAKILGYGDGAVLRMSPEEHAAVQRTLQAEQVRALGVTGTGAAGNFPVPIGIDPTINLSSNGAINPVRQLADVRQMSTYELRLVTSDGVTAQYQPEATEVPDNTPVLAQPVLKANRATSFVPFSFELGQDWGTISQELARVMSDAKDVLEASKFLTGSGTNEPQGILTGLTTSQRVQTTGSGAIAVGDIYAIKAALAATRFYAGSTWAFNSARLDSVFRLTPAGSATEPQLMDSRGGDLLGRPVVEISTMATAGTSGTTWAILADWFAAYVIGDRLGFSFELVPHLFGSSGRPTLQRGALAWWRNDARVKVANAARYGSVL